MKYCAIIIENRDILNIGEIVSSHMKLLPSNWELKWQNHFYHITSIEDYNKVLTNALFWEELLKYEKVLIFQSDSMLLRTGIGEFLAYDYVGAPWQFQEHGGNGGLSLRNPVVMHAICKENPWHAGHGNEDIYFCNMMKILNIGKLAPRNVCEKFSCETIFKLGTFGYHAIEKYLTQQQCETIKTQYDHTRKIR